MVYEGCSSCPYCGGVLKYYDSVSRCVLEVEREKSYISIRRLVCTNCKRVHREIPGEILPYKRYSYDVIKDIDILLIDDYPCDMTLKRWRSLIMQGLLCIKN